MLPPEVKFPDTRMPVYNFNKRTNLVISRTSCFTIFSKLTATMLLCVALALLIVDTHAFGGYCRFAHTPGSSRQFHRNTKLAIAEQDAPNVSPTPAENESQAAAAAALAAETEIKAVAAKEESVRVAAAAKEAARVAAEMEKAAEEEAARKAAEEAARIAAEKEEAARISAEIAANEAAILAQKKEIEGKQRALLAARLSRERTMFDKRFAYAQKLRARQAAVEEARSGTPESIAKYKALVDAQEDLSAKCFTVLCALGMMHDTDDDVPDPEAQDYAIVHGHLDDQHISAESDFFWEVNAERYVKY
jgi:hypothetical protein